MGTTREVIKGWIDRGLEQKATHLIVVSDTFDHDDYPVFAATDAEAIEKYDEYNGKEMQRIMEVYDLRMDLAAQLEEKRAMHLPARAIQKSEDTDLTAAFADYHQKVLALIEKHGFTVQGVFPTEDGQGPTLGYTIGLAAKGLPEVMILGLPPQAVVPILNSVAQQLIGGDIKPEAGQLVHKAASMPLKLVEVAEQVARSYALGAYRHAKTSNSPVKVLQALWPDTRGIYPGTVGCNIEMAREQDAAFQLVMRGGSQ